MEFKQKTLANGLQIAAEVDPQAVTASLGFFVDAGSRHETSALSGVSHFLEHMQFKGTAKRSAEQVNREIDQLGGNSNAYTSEDQTVYYLHVVPEYQTEAVDLLCDIMRPSLREEDFETERKVILEEIAMYDDQPPYGAMEASMEQFFGSHPLANRILGTNESVGALSTTAMRDYHCSRYAPNRLSFVATGAIDFDALVQQVNKATEDWQIAKKASEKSFAIASAEDFRDLIIPIAHQQYVIQLQAAPSRHSQERFACRLAASAIGDEGGSRLFWALIDTGIAETAGLFSQHFDDAGVMASIVACAPEDASKVWSTCLEVIRNVEKEPLSQRELELVRNRIVSSTILAAERPSNRLFSVGNNWSLRGKYETLQQSIEHYTSVTLDQLNQAAMQIATLPSTLTSVGPSPFAA